MFHNPGHDPATRPFRPFDGLLQPERFKDYGPNGLQVEGKAKIRHLVSGVTASRALIEAAIADGADAIFVHHGLFLPARHGRAHHRLDERTHPPAAGA